MQQLERGEEEQLGKAASTATSENEVVFILLAPNLKVKILILFLRRIQIAAERGDSDVQVAALSEELARHVRAAAVDYFLEYAENSLSITSRGLHRDENVYSIFTFALRTDCAGDRARRIASTPRAALRATGVCSLHEQPHREDR